MIQTQSSAPVLSVKAEALSRALKLLNAAGCQYAILAADGTKHGTLELAAPAPERKRAVSRWPRGAMLAHYAPFVKNMKAGESALVPYGPFGSDDGSRTALRGALASWCSHEWGNKTYITHNNAQGVELLRVE